MTAKRLGGWFWKMTSFADFDYCNYSGIVVWTYKSLNQTEEFKLSSKPEAPLCNEVLNHDLCVQSNKIIRE